MGKWSKLLDGKPKKLEDSDNPSRRERIDEARTAILTPSPDLEALVRPADDVREEIQDRFEELIVALQTMNGGKQQGSALARSYIELRETMAWLDGFSDRLSVLKTALTELLDETYEIEGVTNMTLDEGSVRIQPEPYASVADKQKFRKWCVDNGYENDMVLPWPTVNSTVKELLESGEAEPPGIEVFQNRKAVYTKAKD